MQFRHRREAAREDKVFQPIRLAGFDFLPEMVIAQMKPVEIRLNDGKFSPDGTVGVQGKRLEAIEVRYEVG